MKSFLYSLLISILIISNSFGQSEIKLSSIQDTNLFNTGLNSRSDGQTGLHRNFNIKNHTFQNIFLNKLLPKDKTEASSSTLPIAIGALAFFYLLNPILLFENDKIGGGITKELSLGFGYFGEHRTSFEYSYLFRADLKSHMRLAYKYDILLERGLRPSNLLQATPVLSLGAGYFTDFSNHGYFPEVSYGYSIRNDKLLFYPNLKLRYTYVAKGSNIIDFSFGIIIGIANPFIDLKIRRSKN